MLIPGDLPAVVKITLRWRTSTSKAVSIDVLAGHLWRFPVFVRNNESVPRICLELPGGHGLVRRDDGEIVVAHDVCDGRGQPLSGRGDYRPMRVWLDTTRSIVAGRLPPRAASVDVIDDRGAEKPAAVGSGVYAAIVEHFGSHGEPVICCRDEFGAPVPRPLPENWPRKRIFDAEEFCPACGAIDYEEVIPTDSSSGARERHDEHGPLAPVPIIVCRRCGHEEGAGTVLSRYTESRDVDEAARAEDVRATMGTSDAARLRGLAFPVYKARTWAARVVGYGASNGNVTEVAIGHYSESDEHDSFRRPSLVVTTAVADRHRSSLRLAQEALGLRLHDESSGPCPDGASDAATRLWFAARRRDQRCSALGARRTEFQIALEDSLQTFLGLSTPSRLWAASAGCGSLTITITARSLNPSTLRLEQADLTALLLESPS